MVQQIHSHDGRHWEMQKTDAATNATGQIQRENKNLPKTNSWNSGEKTKKFQNELSVPSRCKEYVGGDFLILSLRGR